VQEELLDTIETANLTIVGIVDYVSTKHITIYDMTNNDDPDLSMAAIIYKLYFSDMRFSVYKSLYFAHHDIPPPVMINKNAIKRSTKNLVTEKPNRKAFKITNRT
jgi:hypothetical protein